MIMIAALLFLPLVEVPTKPAAPVNGAKCEYKVVDLGESWLFRWHENEARRKEFIGGIDKLGLEGWELITIVTQTSPPQMGGGAISLYPRWLYYKRSLAGEERKKWQYKLVDLPLSFPNYPKADGTVERKVLDELAKQAEDGWEFAAVIRDWSESEWSKPGGHAPRYYVLKRPNK